MFDMETADGLSSIELMQPGYLAVLALLPVVVVLARRSLSGLGRVRGGLAICLRCLVIAVVSLALTSPEWVQTTDDQSVVFALDQSDSVPRAAREDARQFIRAASAGMRPGKDQIALLGFDGRPSVEQICGPEFVADHVGAPIEPHRTNVAGALRLGLALLPADTAKRIVVLSDGNENVGSAAEEAEICAALGIPIDVLPLQYEHGSEILVDQFSAPAAAKQDEVVSLRLVLRSQAATGARVFLYHNDRQVRDGAGPTGGFDVQLAAGPNRFTIPVALRAAGVHRFRAVVEPAESAADTLATNNEARAFTIVGPAERVLIISDTAMDPAQINETSAALLARALQQGGIECVQMGVEELPADPAALADCSAVILSNVSAFALGEARQQALASYVRDQGGGLIVVGGDQSLSVGGYGYTPLEQVLPVETARDKLQLLSLAMVIVIDRSGSMLGEKITMACEAARASVQLLSSHDRVGVIAFHSASDWAVELQPAGDKNRIARQIDGMEAGGGTNMYPALRHAYLALVNVDSNLKHIIVLTDGQSMPGDFEGIASTCAADGITISTVAVGPDADRLLLSRIAELSGGRMYVADSARPLPQIFTRETVLASRSGMYERQFTPRLLAGVNDQILDGFTQADIPPLHGCVVSEAKPLSQTPLARITEDGTDPIMAYWQFGLGRAVAFTSGLWPKWGPEWANWPGFSKLWTQAVRYAGRPGTSLELQLETGVKGGEGHVLVSAEHLPFRWQGTLALSGRLTRPDFSSEPLRLQRTAANRFEATFSAEAPGTYLISVPYEYGAGDDGKRGVLRGGLVVNYSPEYRALRDNSSALAEMARRTGGRVLNASDPGAVFETWSIRPVRVRSPFWEDLVRLGLVLFLLDVAVRRIAVTPAEVAGRIRSFIREAVGRPAAEEAAATLATLRGVKERKRVDQSPRPPESSRVEEAALPGSAPERQPGDSLSQVLGGAAADKPVVAAPPPKRRPTGTTESEYAARLLRAKRRARDSTEP